MTLEHRIEIVEGAGRPVLRKWALTPAGEAALAREAERLGRARHPGVVALLATTVDHLDLDWAGAETMALARLTRGDAARVLTQVAATVADLHDRGIVHGRLDASHVVIGAGTTGVLCGLRGAEPGRAEPGPADDVGDIGRLLQHALGMGADAELVPERRWRSWSRPGGRDQVLEELAARAADPDPARRPTARALARALAEVVPDVALPPADGRSGVVATDPAAPAASAADAGLDGAPAKTTVDRAEDGQAEPEDRGGAVAGASDVAGGPAASKVVGARLLVRSGRPADPHPAPRPSVDDATRSDDGAQHDPGAGPTAAEVEVDRAGLMARRPVLTWIGGALGLVVVGLALSSHQAPGRDPGTGTATAATAVAVAVAASAPATVAPSTSAPPSPSTTTAPPTSVRVVDATTVEVDGRRYQVGQADDRLAVADWDCDGSASPGLVRPSTGEIFLFDRWPSDTSATVEANSVVPGARALLGSAPGPGCTAPQVELAEGGRVPLLHEVGR